MAAKDSEQGEQLWAAVFEQAKTEPVDRASDRSAPADEIHYENLTKAAGDKS